MHMAAIYIWHGCHEHTLLISHKDYKADTLYSQHTPKAGSSESIFSNLAWCTCHAAWQETFLFTKKISSCLTDALDGRLIHGPLPSIQILDSM